MTTHSYPIVAGILDVAIRDQRAWVVGYQSLYELNSVSGELLRTTPLSSEDNAVVQVNDAGVWVASLDRLTRIEPQSGDVMDDVTFPSLVNGFVASDEASWISLETGQLLRLDAGTGQTVASYDLQDSGKLFAAENGGVWVVPTSGEDKAYLVNAAGTPTLTIDGAGGAVVNAGAYSWTIYHTLDADSLVVAFDPHSRTTVASFAIPRAAYLASLGDSLWIFSHPGSTDPELFEPDPKKPARVWLIDANTLAVTAAADVDNSPASLRATQTGAWITHFTSGMVTRVEN